MQTDSINIGIAYPSNHWIFHFLQAKFHVKVSKKGIITFELKALSQMTLTKVVL